ncbi:hypothetical protein IM816_17325 [Luteibacter flocculans]|uniref:Uncharacterized protein n=1 Tax=Luteibacter flocculans TaxID=2780091 RepID=A0ABY4T053_9GAMM|nr:hypothetical protein [Luteibacter flocculans]URL58328.1 hypothetical protein IM816_17325 [Luteibacter flocculans]
MKALICVAAVSALIAGAPSAQAQFSRDVINQGHGDWGRCIAYLPPLTLAGRLNGGDSEVVFTWRTTCHSSFSASASGATVVLQRLSGSGWVDMTSGFPSYVPDLGPGTYRIVAKNEWARAADYQIRHRRGLG